MGLLKSDFGLEIFDICQNLCFQEGFFQNLCFQEGFFQECYHAHRQEHPVITIEVYHNQEVNHNQENNQAVRPAMVSRRVSRCFLSRSVSRRVSRCFEATGGFPGGFPGGFGSFQCVQEGFQEGFFQEC